MTPDGFTARYGGRRYEVRAIEQPNPARLRATVKAVRAVRRPGRALRHIDTVDFYLSRSRRDVHQRSGPAVSGNVEVIEADMNRLIEQLETYAQKQTARARQTRWRWCPTRTRPRAMKLGRHPDLAGEILRDMERLGLVGEATNKLIGYLVMTSRKMADPLALLILSGSGAGKAHLQDTLLCLCPDEDLIKLTSLTDRALFYKGEDSLKNKVLAVEELAGARGRGLRHPQSHSAQKTGH